MKRVLIAYVTKTNTTKEVAAEIRQVLEAQGFLTDVLPIADVASLTEYQAVIVGAPINGMNWHPDATAFVTRFQQELNAVPTSFFLVSYLLFTGCDFWKKIIRKRLDKVSALVKPVSVGMFGGRIEKPFPAFPRFMFGVKKGAPIDVTNLEDVRAWALDWTNKVEK